MARPYLLARAMGDDPQIVDLDGDGSNELCAASPYSAQLFFRREGRLYAADVRALMQSAWPEIGPWDAAAWDFNHRRLTVSGAVNEAAPPLSPAMSISTEAPSKSTRRSRLTPPPDAFVHPQFIIFRQGCAMLIKISAARLSAGGGPERKDSL